MDDVVEKDVIEIIAMVSGFDEDEITHTSNMAENLEIDSIRAIRTTVTVEKKFGISIRDEEIPNITTVQ